MALTKEPTWRRLANGKVVMIGVPMATRGWTARTNADGRPMTQAELDAVYNLFDFVMGEMFFDGDPMLSFWRYPAPKATPEEEATRYLTD